ncbi:unnamed protein product [[Candida] boidinii]|uniref:Unnamed protein product n=1 Tax=Candida boidinii TaxID=5477 RepID=A0ACB5TK02_CANBO|nr:unnamed protein product [[Candida] boidinii]
MVDILSDSAAQSGAAPNHGHGGATFKSSVINLMNTIMGAGMLAMPYAIRANGVVLGVFFIAFSACCSSFGLYLQGQCTRYVPKGQASFFSLSKLTYPQLGVVFDIAIAIKCFGVGISYLVVIGDLMPKIVSNLVNDDYLATHDYLLSRNLWISLFMFVIIAPLSFLRKLDSLKYASMIALSSVAYLVILVFVHFAHNDIIEKGTIRIFKPESVSRMLSNFPIFVFAYTCHQNMFSIVNELKINTPKMINNIIEFAIGMACFLYILVGVSGYLTFGDLVQGNVIAMYPDSTGTTIGRIAIVILVMLSFPLQCHPCRSSTNHVLHYFTTSELAESIRSLSRSNTNSSNPSSFSNNMTVDERRRLILGGNNGNMNSLNGSINASPKTSSSRSVSVSSNLQPVTAYAQLNQATNKSSTAAAMSLSANTTLAANPREDYPGELEDEAIMEDATNTSIITTDTGIMEGRGSNQHSVSLGTKKFIILTSIIVLLSYFVALKVQSLEFVLSLVGSTGSTSISFILPGIFAYKLIGSQQNEEITNKLKFIKIGACLLTIWGFIVMFICLTATLFLGAKH